MANRVGDRTVEMTIDDSFKKPGAIPFKWEIRPGVPKHQQATKQSTLLEQKQKQRLDNGPRLPCPLLKLRAPPGGFSFPSLVPETQIMTQSEVVESGCFTSPLLKHKDYNQRSVRFKCKSDMKTDHGSDILALPRSYELTQIPLSMSRHSPLASSFSSYQSSPCLFNDPEWVGFGLF